MPGWLPAITPCTIGAKNLTRRQTGPFFDRVRSIDLLVQFREGGCGASMVTPM